MTIYLDHKNNLNQSTNNSKHNMFKSVHEKNFIPATLQFHHIIRELRLGNLQLNTAGQSQPFQ